MGIWESSYMPEDEEMDAEIAWAEYQDYLLWLDNQQENLPRIGE